MGEKGRRGGGGVWLGGERKAEWRSEGGQVGSGSSAGIYFLLKNPKIQFHLKKKKC